MAWHRSLLEQLTTSSEQQLPPNISHQGCIVCTSIRVKDLSHLSREMTMSRCITTVFYCTSSLLLWMHFASRSVAQSICKTAFYPDVMPWETERWRVAEHSALPNTGRNKVWGCNLGIYKLQLSGNFLLTLEKKKRSTSPFGVSDIPINRKHLTKEPSQ